MGERVKPLVLKTRVLTTDREFESRPLRRYVKRRPMVWWQVQGRKMFDTKYSPALRAMWGCGKYPIS